MLKPVVINPCGNAGFFWFCFFKTYRGHIFVRMNKMLSLTSLSTNSCPAFGSSVRRCGPVGPFLFTLLGLLGLNTSEIAFLIAYSSDFSVIECITE